jgi:hypothetical protein
LLLAVADERREADGAGIGEQRPALQELGGDEGAVIRRRIGRGIHAVVHCRETQRERERERERERDGRHRDKKETEGGLGEGRKTRESGRAGEFEASAIRQSDKARETGERGRGRARPCTAQGFLFLFFFLINIYFR